MRRFLLSTLIGLGLLSGPALLCERSAHAQDDWGVRRDPFDKGLIRRYKGILAKRPDDAKALGKLMAMYRRYRSLGLLVREYESAQERKPSYANLMVLGYLARHGGDAAAARGHFEAAAKLAPNKPVVHVELGTMLRAAGESQKAAAHFEKALSLSTGKREKMASLRALADLAMDAGDIEGAKRHLESFIKLDPKNSQTQIELGEALAAHKRYDEAIKIFRNLESKLRGDPLGKVELITRIGQALEGKGEALAAVKEYERGIKIGGRGYYTTKELTARIVSIYRERQELDVLAKKLETQWKGNRRSHFEWDTLARLYEETGNPEEAIKAYRKATKSAPYELDTQRRLIALLENSGREAEALKQYEAVIRVAPGEPRFQLELARRYWGLGEEKKAMAMAKKIQTHFSSDAGVISSLADLYTGWQKPKEALAAYETLTRIEPNDSRHLENLGERHFQDGNRSKAEKTWQKIIRVKSAANYARLASIYAEHDMLSESIAMYGKAIAIEKKNVKLYKGRANVLERLRRTEDAIRDWETVLALSPDKKSYASERREARRRVVSLLARRGHGRSRNNALLRTRMQAWEAGFAQTPPRLGDGFYLVEAYRQTGDLNKLQTTLKKLLVLRPSDQSVMTELVKNHRSLREYDAAIELLLRLVKLNPGRERDYYNQIAEIKTDLQLDDEAIEYVRRALDKSPNDPVAYQRLAERYQAMQKQSKAIEAYEKVLELSPRSFPVAFTLGRLYVNSGEREKATKLYRDVLKNASSQEVLRKAGREAVELEWLSGTLPGLLKTLTPLVAANGHKPIYRRIVVQVYDRLVPTLASKLDHPDAKVRESANRELEKLGKLGLRPLLEALADEAEPMQQQAAVSVLGYLGNASAAAPLVRLAERPAPKRGGHASLVPTLEWDTRVQALIAAARLGDARTLPTLIKLSQHKDLSMREVAVFALGVTKSPKALPAVLAASREPQGSVQTLACLAFAEFDDAKSIRTSSSRALEVLEDESATDESRAACAWLLGYRRHLQARDSLLRTLARGNDQTQRLSAWALGQLGDASAIADLVAAYATKREPVRSSAMHALATLLANSRNADQPTARHVAYPIGSRGFDRRQAIRSLASAPQDAKFDPGLLIGKEKQLASGLRTAITQHRDLVLRALADLDQDARVITLGPLTEARADLGASQQAALVKTMHEVGRELRPELSELAVHRDPEVRARALRVLAKVGGPEVREILIAGLSDGTLEVRTQTLMATAAVARPGQGSEFATLVATRLAASAWQERVAAAKALGQWPAGEHSAAHRDALIKALTGDEKGFVRAAAASALAMQLAGKGNAAAGAIAALARAADVTAEPLATVRYEAVRALQAIGGPMAREAARSISKSDPSKRVRDAASAI